MTFYYTYRKNGGEVGPYGVNPPEGLDSYFGVFETETDYGGVKPLKWSDGVTLRDATQNEIDYFPIAEADDNFDRNKEIAKSLMDDLQAATDPKSIKDRATLIALIEQVSLLRVQAGLGAITNAQAKTGIKSEIDNMIRPSS